MYFLRPIASDHNTQKFGEAGVCAQKRINGDLVRPFVIVNKRPDNTCPQGYTDFYKRIGMNGHNGGDWAAWSGEPTYHCALFPGLARMPIDDVGHPSADAGIEVVSIDAVMECTAGCPKGTMHHIVMRYAHGTPAVAAGTRIETGDLVQRAGNIGSSSGVHVHWAPKWADANGKIIHRDNGFDGAFDYGPNFQNQFVLDYLHEHWHGDPKPLPPTNIDLPYRTPVDLSTLDSMKKALFQASVFLSGLYPRKA